MPRYVLLLVLALAVAALSQEFVIPNDARVCSADNECTMVLNWGDCCASAHCGYSAVNVKSSAHYTELYSVYVKANCSSPVVDCAHLACEPLPVFCNKTSGAETGTCAFRSSPSVGPCPGDGPIFECIVDPCTTAKCAAHPDATCVADYCGGCNAKFYVGDVEVKCDATTNCPNGHPPAECLTSPCLSAKCSAYGSAECRVNYCAESGCVAEFFVDNVKVDCTTTSGPKPVPSEVTKCADGSTPVACFADPCQNRHCSAYPDATCVANYCGGCNYDFFVGENKVNCEAECATLPCGDCLAKSSCSYCSASYTVNAEGKEAPVTDSIGVCISSTGFAADLCISAKTGGSLIASTDHCPAAGSTGGDTGVKTETTDPAPFQHDIETAPKPVSTKFTIVVALVVKQLASNPVHNNVVKLFVDLVGAGTPTQEDKDDLCVILKNTLAKLEANVPAEKITCSLDEKVTVKRDAAYVASLSYPATAQNGSSSSLVASFVAVAVAVVALVF